jgi:hypothetical protein
VFVELDTMFSAALARFDQEFIAVISDARDTVGRALAHVMLTIRPESLTFHEVAARFLESMEAQGHAALMPAMLAHFLWRGIDPSPFLHFRQVASPGRVRRRRDPFRLQITPHHVCGVGCHSAGSLRTMHMIRAAHASGTPRRRVSG